MHSRFFENVVAELVALTEGESELKVRRALQNSRMLSSDVSAAYDPMYAEVFEKRSAAFFGKGLVFNKFTGSRGKSGSNDANAEYLAKIRNAMDAQAVAYQFAELGKVDAGGGGTIAYIMAKHAAPENVPDNQDDFLEQFNTFSIYEILPQLIDRWGLNVETQGQSKKTSPD